MRIPEDDYGIEIILSIELGDTATAILPAWAKFAVTSVAGDSNEWTQYYTGLVKVEVSLPAEKDEIDVEIDPRFPSSQVWYDKFTEIGLGYNETFRSLSEI